MSYGILYMIPVTLGDDNIERALPNEVIALARNLDTFIVENERTARRFLSMLKTITPVREITLLSLNEHTADNELPELLQPLLTGKNVGLMSEAGCPGIADPGARIADLAQRKGIRVAPLVGPSSILLSLMASGMNGQQFAFLGYLPAEKQARIQKLKEIEKRSKMANETQIFIETPYRNQHLLDDMIVTCMPSTRLCIACNISLESEHIATKTIEQWKKSSLPDLHRQPTVFLIHA